MHAPNPVSYTHLDVYKRQVRVIPFQMQSMLLASSSTADLVGKTVVAEAGSAGAAAIEGDENLAQADYVSKSVQTDCLMEVAAGTADALSLIHI